jgi:hypothetical protein
MPSINCKGCNKSIRNPPSYKLTRPITGYCAKCLGLAHKTPLVIVIEEEKLNKLHLKERQLNFLADSKRVK